MASEHRGYNQTGDRNADPGLSRLRERAPVLTADVELDEPVRFLTDPGYRILDVETQAYIPDVDGLAGFDGYLLALHESYADNFDFAA